MELPGQKEIYPNTIIIHYQNNSMSFSRTARLVVSVVFILIALGLALAMVGKLYQFFLFRDTWFFSQALSRGIVMGVFGGIAWWIHPSDND